MHTATDVSGKHLRVAFVHRFQLSKHELVEKCAICMFKLSVIVNINTVITEGLIANLVG